MLQIVFIDNDDFQFSEDIKSQARGILNKANEDVREYLPSLSKHLTFTIFPTRHVIPETGETASTVSKSWIRFSIDPDHTFSLDEILNKNLRRTFFHEAHHATRYQTQKWGESVISDSIFEGLGTVFERDFADGNPLWGQYDTKTIQAWTKELLKLSPNDKNKQDWFFTHPDGRRWIAYKVGTYIVDEAIKNNPGVTCASLVNVSAQDILAMSKVA